MRKSAVNSFLISMHAYTFSRQLAQRN